MISRPSSGPHVSITASQISNANSGSVSMKISGEYSSPTTVSPSSSSASLMICATPAVASFTVETWSLPNTTSRNKCDVAL